MLYVAGRNEIEIGANPNRIGKSIRSNQLYSNEHLGLERRETETQ